MSQPDRKTFRRLRLTGVVAAIVAVVIVVYGIATRASENSRLHDWTEAQALPTVAIISPSAGGNSNGLELPGRFEAYTRAPIYARTSGYLKSWKYDIGAHVKAGDLLGEIETPDLDQQLQQARADLATAQANERLSALTAQRWQKILAMNAVAKQDVDEKLGDYEAKKAATASAKANVDRYVAMKGFTRLVAPFDGIVTARNTDVGALISVGGAAGQELFVVSDTHRLRVYVNVPQSNVPGIVPGTKATIIAPEHPDKTYMATVEASSQSVNAASGTSLMQLAVDNPSGELLPGGYATVRLDLAGRHDVLTVPASALIFNAKGLAVATVGTDNRVAIKPVVIARDLGKVIELGGGIEANDRVIESPPDGIANGSEVRIAGAAPKAMSEKKG
jgi:RND family efflux transporter MFP subunit